MICVLAYLLVRVIQRRVEPLGLTGTRALEPFRSVMISELELAKTGVTRMRVTDLRDDHRRILSTLGIEAHRFQEGWNRLGRVRVVLTMWGFPLPDRLTGTAAISVSSLDLKSFLCTSVKRMVKSGQPTQVTRFYRKKAETTPVPKATVAAANQLASEVGKILTFERPYSAEDEDLTER